jgi:hypothetical protein
MNKENHYSGVQKTRTNLEGLKSVVLMVTIPYSYTEEKNNKAMYHYNTGIPHDLFHKVNFFTF